MFERQRVRLRKLFLDQPIRLGKKPDRLTRARVTLEVMQSVREAPCQLFPHLLRLSLVRFGLMLWETQFNLHFTHIVSNRPLGAVHLLSDFAH